MLFYAAIHCLERLFAEDGIHHPDHQQRNRYLIRNCSSIWPEYNLLKGESTKARYLDRGGFTLKSEQVRKRLREEAFEKIQRYVDTRLAAMAQDRKG